MAAWITLSDLKTYFNITNTALDTKLAACITMAQAAVEQELLKANLVYGTFTDVVEYITVNDYQDAFFTEQHHFITTLTYLKENDSELTENSDFYLSKSIGKFTRAGGYWTTTPKGIEVKYSVTNAVPEDMKLALMQYTGVIAGIATKTYITNEGIEKTADQGIPQFVKDIIECHRIPREAMING